MKQTPINMCIQSLEPYEHFRLHGTNAITEFTCMGNSLIRYNGSLPTHPIAEQAQGVYRTWSGIELHRIAAPGMETSKPLVV